MTFADKFKDMVAEVNTNRTHIISAQSFQSQAKTGVQELDTKMGRVDSKVETVGQVVQQLQTKLGEWEKEIMAKMHSHQTTVNQKVAFFEK